MYKLVDFHTKLDVVPKNFVFTGETSPWEVVIDPNIIRSRLNVDYFRKSPPYVSKYLPFMPIEDFGHFISLQEGASPLIHSSKIGPDHGIDLMYKLEFQNPTGSFKDRGSAVELSIAKEMNVKGIVLASTGNMAASCSCYAAAAQIPCFVFVPEDTPTSKLAQAISYGGKIVQVKGGYTEAAALSKEVAETLGFYLAGDYAFRVEGQKTGAFEVIDQLFFQVPDVIVIPIGCGTNLAAYVKGLREYLELGFIDRMPQIIGVQATGACPVVNSFQKGQKNVGSVESVETIAGAIGIATPLDGDKALEGIYATGGIAVAVSDREMLEAQFMLSRSEGLFVETSSAAAVAATLKLNREHSFAKKRVVCVLTGSGLKDPSSILNIAIKPPTIYPDVNEFFELYNKSFFEGTSVSFVNKQEVVFTEAPEEAAIQQRLKEFFNVAYAQSYVEKIKDIASRFLKKGKAITFSDFQDIVQEAVENQRRPTKEVFSVEDFEVTTGKDRKSEARVVVMVNNERLEASDTGVGPVDSVINALNKACGSRIQFSLSNYRVAIRSQGTDAVVYVELKLIKDGVRSVGTGTSPDIIQASIEAFEGAYNGFYL